MKATVEVCVILIGLAVVTSVKGQYPPPPQPSPPTPAPTMVNATSNATQASANSSSVDSRALECRTFFVSIKLEKAPPPSDSEPYHEMKCHICENLRMIYRCYPCFSSLEFQNVTTDNNLSYANIIMKFSCNEAHLRVLEAILKPGSIVTPECRDQIFHPPPPPKECHATSTCACAVPVCTGSVPYEVTPYPAPCPVHYPVQVVQQQQPAAPIVAPEIHHPPQVVVHTPYEQQQLTPVHTPLEPVHTSSKSVHTSPQSVHTSQVHNAAQQVNNEAQPVHIQTYPVVAPQVPVFYPFPYHPGFYHPLGYSGHGEINNNLSDQPESEEGSATVELTQEHQEASPPPPPVQIIGHTFVWPPASAPAPAQELHREENKQENREPEGEDTRHETHALPQPIYQLPYPYMVPYPYLYSHAYNPRYPGYPPVAYPMAVPVAQCPFACDRACAPTCSRACCRSQYLAARSRFIQSLKGPGARRYRNPLYGRRR
ncbi:uncharacterized protein LOC5513480 isoform X2 [Nematostella vectensis]|uniref:uncharacterized protein LOC5513480 isoform X2 n=1 Tax=Nematostella vectensis TaxID=45351 RepID=UPI0020779889|nr:uncharacterized protein LOC5513480 isoform X2 [Nematostella vectensis]